MALYPRLDWGIGLDWMVVYGYGYGYGMDIEWVWNGYGYGYGYGYVFGWEDGRYDT